MKKAVTITLTAMLAASALCGCSKAAAQTSAVRIPQPSDTNQTQVQQDADNPDKITVDDDTTENNKKRIQIIIDNSKLGGFIGNRRKKPISGVRRHFKRDRSGNYSVEYIHTPYGIDKDETLDYNLSLNDDNSFELTVVSDGVTAEHSGRWYENKHRIILFYDDDVETQHNVQVTDKMHCELLPKGKIMFTDNNYTVVLSKQQNEYEIMPIANRQ